MKRQQYLLVWIVLAMVCTFCGSFISGCGPLDQSGTVERIRAHQAVMRGEARPEVSLPEEPEFLAEVSRPEKKESQASLEINGTKRGIKYMLRGWISIMEARI